MAITLDTREYLDTICALLAQGHSSVAVPVRGSSMVPFLHNGDTVYLNVPTRPLKKGDIVLYTRPEGRYILHRICGIRPDGSFLIAGDAQQELELVHARQICAIVTSARHRGKLISPGSLYWWAYRHIWRWLRPLRHRLMALR